LAATGSAAGSRRSGSPPQDFDPDLPDQIDSMALNRAIVERVEIIAAPTPRSQFLRSYRVDLSILED